MAETGEYECGEGRRQVMGFDLRKKQLVVFPPVSVFRNLGNVKAAVIILMLDVKRIPQKK